MKQIHKKFLGLVVIMIVMISLTGILNSDSKITAPSKPDLKPLFSNQTDEETIIILTPKVNLTSPEDGAKILEKDIVLEWELVDGDPRETLYDIYFDKDYPPKLHQADHGNNKYVISNQPAGTYYWRVFPKTNDIRGDCLSGYWSLSYLPYDVAVTGEDQMTITRGDVVSINLKIHNNAINYDYVDVEVDTHGLPEEYVSYYWSPLFMQGEIYAYFHLGFVIPSSATTGSYTVSVKAISASSGDMETDTHDINVVIVEKNMMGEDEPDDTSDSFFSADFAFCCVFIFFIVIIVVYALYNETKRQKKSKKGSTKYQWYQQPKWQYQYQAHGRTRQSPPASWPARETYYMNKGEIKEAKDVDLEDESIPVKEHEEAGSAPDLFKEPESSVPVGAPVEDKVEEKELPVHTKCSRCGLMLPADADFCPQCGMRADGALFKCPICNSAVYPGEDECKNCGAEFEDLDTDKPVVKKQKPKVEEPHKPQLRPTSVEKPKKSDMLKFDRTEDLRKKPIDKLTEREINVLRVENLELSDKLYVLETDRAMGKISRDDFLKKRLGLLKRFLKK